MKETSMTPREIQDLFRTRLGHIYEEREIVQITRLLFEHLLGWDSAELHLSAGQPLRQGQSLLMEALDQLVLGKPVQYIIGVTEFRDLRLRVTEAALIPRPETEELVDLVIRENRHRSFQRFYMLDIGTGTGCIALALKKAFPYAEVDALDQSQAALDLAAENSSRLGFQVRLLQADILDPVETGRLAGYDLIVSNPPYVLETERSAMRANVLDYEPHEALFVPDDDPLRFYKVIASFAWWHLLRPGMLYLEINERFGKEISEMLRSTGFEKVAVHKDMNGRDRFVTGEAKTEIKDTSYWMVDKDLPSLT